MPGSTTPLPLGIPVTTNAVDGTNRGYGNTGSNNIGNGNTVSDASACQIIPPDNETEAAKPVISFP